MDRTIRITPKDSEELAFLCELFDRLGLEYSVDDEAPAGSNSVREPAEEYVKTTTQNSGSEMRDRIVAPHSLQKKR